MRLLLANVPTMICVVVAGILAWKGAEGWGWFLGVGFLLGHIWEDEA